MTADGAGKSFSRLFFSAFIGRRARVSAGDRSLKIKRTGQDPLLRECREPAYGAAFSVEALWERARRAGQVTVELLLVLPIFMLMLFCIMEVGNLSYQVILAHHCAYELARIGSLVAGPNGGGGGGGNEEQKMNDTLRKDMFPNRTDIQLSADRIPTFPDPQVSDTNGSHVNEDLQVKLIYPAKLVFPGSSCILSDGFPARCTRSRTVVVTVRMPIEKPFFQ